MIRPALTCVAGVVVTLGSIMLGVIAAVSDWPSVFIEVARCGCVAGCVACASSIVWGVAKANRKEGCDDRE